MRKRTFRWLWLYSTVLSAALLSCHSSPPEKYAGDQTQEWGAMAEWWAQHSAKYSHPIAEKFLQQKTSPGKEKGKRRLPTFQLWESPFPPHLSQKDKIGVILQYDGSIDALKNINFEIFSSFSNFFVGEIPIYRLHKLKGLPGVRRVELRKKLRLHLNLSSPAVGAPQVYRNYHLDGSGVIVGIVDTGIDYTHPAFRNPDGTTRILAILDFSLEDPDRNKPPRLFLKPEIDRALKSGEPLPHADRVGHGTHIAGIAAGNACYLVEGESDKCYRGIAPRADLIVVKAVRGKGSQFDSGDLLQAISFIHNLAKKLKKSYVINLSLGSQYGGHDGSELLDRALSEFSGPGKPGQIIVASAGNEGSLPIHAAGWFEEKTLALKLELTDSKKKKSPLKEF